MELMYHAIISIELLRFHYKQDNLIQN